MAARAQYGLTRSHSLAKVVESCVYLCGNALTAHQTVAPFLAPVPVRRSGDAARSSVRRTYKAEMLADTNQTAIRSDLFQRDSNGTARFPTVWVTTKELIGAMGRYFEEPNELQVASNIYKPKQVLQHGRTVSTKHDKIALIVLHEMLHWYCARFVDITIPTYKGEIDPGHGTYTWQLLAR